MASPRQYPEELKVRAVRMVREIGERGAIKRVADHLDINPETLRNWGVSRTRKEAGCRNGL